MSFIREFKERVHWRAISRNQRLSLDFRGVLIKIICIVVVLLALSSQGNFKLNTNTLFLIRNSLIDIYLFFIEIVNKNNSIVIIILRD